MAIESWVELWRRCHRVEKGAIHRIEWPDARSLLTQPMITIEVFDLIKEQLLAELALASGK